VELELFTLVSSIKENRCHPSPLELVFCPQVVTSGLVLVSMPEQKYRRRLHLSREDSAFLLTSREVPLMWFSS